MTGHGAGLEAGRGSGQEIFSGLIYCSCPLPRPASVYPNQPCHPD